MDAQKPVLKTFKTSYEEGNPIGRATIVLDHLGVEMTIAVPTRYESGGPNFHVQAEQFFRDAADLCAEAAAEMKRIAERG